MTVQDSELEQRAGATQPNTKAHTTQKGTILSVTIVGVFILFVYVVMYGLYLARV